MVNNVLAPSRSLHSQYFTTQKIHSIFAMISYLLFAAKDVYYSHQIGNPLTYSWKMLRRNLLRKIRLRRLNRFFETYSYQDKYYLYPLHFHPESSTSVQAPDYIDELSTIRNIAFSLPFGSYLYVKDHKSAAGYQSPAFYQGIKNLPNVKLLHYNCDTKKLITHAQGIITLTSTVGYEALLLGKPVYLLGRVFYEGHPNCTSIAAPRDLFPLLNKAPPQAPVDPYLTAAFAEAYYQHTFEGSLDTSKRSHPREFYQTIAKYIDHLPNIMPAAHIGNPHENPSGWATTTSDNRLRHSQ
jgi:capsule polysaccharide modification protein KpsS